MIAPPGGLLGIGLLLGLLVLVAAPILLAISLVATVLRLVFFAVTLPLRILGWIAGAGFGLLGGVLALLLLIGLVPLLPFVLVGALIYRLARRARPRPASV